MRSRDGRRAVRHGTFEELGGVLMASQTGRVLARLQAGEKLSSRDAVLNYGIQDLPKRISDLRAIGYEIESERVNGVNRDGSKTHWNEYWMSR